MESACHMPAHNAEFTRLIIRLETARSRRKGPNIRPTLIWRK